MNFLMFLILIPWNKLISDTFYCHGIKQIIPGINTTLSTPKVSIKVIYSYGIKLFYGGVVFEPLW
jgi:hypothetical protein